MPNGRKHRQIGMAAALAVELVRTKERDPTIKIARAAGALIGGALGGRACDPPASS